MNTGLFKTFMGFMVAAMGVSMLPEVHELAIVQIAAGALLTAVGIKKMIDDGRK